MPKLVCSVAAGLMLVNGTATAHSWYPHECCSENDCHPVPCAELVLTPEGDVKWKGVLYFSRRMFDSRGAKKMASGPVLITCKPGGG
jgi:hypothetical protein